MDAREGRDIVQIARVIPFWPAKMTVDRGRWEAGGIEKKNARADMKRERDRLNRSCGRRMMENIKIRRTYESWNNDNDNNNDDDDNDNNNK